MPYLMESLLKATIYPVNLSPKIEMFSYSTTFQFRGGERFIDRSYSLSSIEFSNLCSNCGRYGMHVAKLMVAQPGMNNYLADQGYLKCSAQGERNWGPSSADVQ